MIPVPDGDSWLHIGPEPMPVAQAMAWAVQPDCGAVVTFVGTVRDHAEGRQGVVGLDYEAYLEPGLRRLSEIAEGCCSRWPDVGRVALLHRLGPLGVTDVSVVVVVSSPHRPEAFEAARWAIDTLKSTVPIWKKETWQDGSALGSDWGTQTQPVVPVPDHAGSSAPADGNSGVDADQMPAGGPR
ncbi:MAG: molybdenum cofactor biosynthesis protein MoaE [Acidimicrobiales bacterium]